MPKVQQSLQRRRPATQFSGTIRPNGRIWGSAEQFYKAAEQVWNSEGVDLNAFVFPLIVNYALCAELSLKAAEGGAVGGGLAPDGLVKAAKIVSTAHGHNLVNVFASLELPTQAAIESEFLAASGEQLAPLLAECSDYFIQARYAYEHIGGRHNLSGIRALAKGLLDAVKAFGIKNMPRGEPNHCACAVMDFLDITLVRLAGGRSVPPSCRVEHRGLRVPDG